jgi:hypothetical protein
MGNIGAYVLVDDDVNPNVYTDISSQHSGLRLRYQGLLFASKRHVRSQLLSVQRRCRQKRQVLLARMSVNG